VDTAALIGSVIFGVGVLALFERRYGGRRMGESYCTHCRSRLKRGASFCHHCGQGIARLSQESDPSPQHDPGRRARCATCGRRVRGLPDARVEGSDWYCSPSCFLQAASSGSRQGEPSRKIRQPVRTAVKWTLFAVVLLIVVSVVPAAVGVGEPSPKRRASASRAEVVATSPPVRSVRRRVVRPRVVVAKSGFSQDRDIGGSGSEINYGVVLANKSRKTDALKMTIVVRAVDTRGRSVATNETPITGIPAGGTFTVTGLLLPNVSLAVTKLRVKVRIGQAKPRSLRLPRTSNVRLHVGGQLLDVTGRLTNPYRRALSEEATIYVAFLDVRGRIVGATSDTTGARVQPRATVSFHVTGVVNDPTAHPVSARVSIDPCSDYDVLLGNCAAPRGP
jgi:hypothetical protein